MGSYRVAFQRSAEKDLRRLAREALPRVLTAIDSLRGNPLPMGSQKLAGATHTYRIRVGDYRVIYQIIGHESILIVRVRHRREVYRD